MLERRPLGDAFIIETTSTMVAPRSPTTQQPTRREWILEPAWILEYLPGGYLRISYKHDNTFVPEPKPHILN